MMTTIALNTRVISGAMPTEMTVVVSVWITKAPTRVPPSVNFPPIRDVPPSTTARIASSSIHSPLLFASAAVTFELIMRPAIAAHSALNTYTVQMMLRDRTPASRLASGLIPTASTRVPSAVRRVSAAVIPNSAPAIKIDTGSVSQYPAPISLYGALVIVMIWPFVMSIAIPRPAVIRISVAMIGWMPTTETRNPFHTPVTSATAIARQTAIRTVERLPGSGALAMYVHATAPAMATTAPTDRSMPRVAITRVIPSATRSVGAPLRRMSMSEPYRCPSCMRIDTKLGRAMTFTTSRATRVITGQNSLLRVSAPISPALRSR